MNWSAADSSCMARALALAERGRFTTHPNPRVGCVIARDGEILGRGWHHKAGEPHAEINALHAAGAHLRGATAYVTLEPCAHQGRTPPCTAALVKAGISRIVVAVQDPNPQVAGAGIKALTDAGIKVETGLMAEQAKELNKGFFSRMTRARPYLRAKSAISLDGKTALAGGESRWITGAASRRDVQALRAASSAVMTGINTVLADDPRLNVRELDTGDRQPLRVVLDRTLRFPPAAQMLGLDGATILFTRNEDDRLHGALERAGARVRFVDGDEDGFLEVVLRLLAQDYEVNDLLLEAGATLTGSMLQHGLIDELVVYQAPVILGCTAVGMAALPTLSAMDQRHELDLVDYRRIDEDWKFVYRVLAHLRIKQNVDKIERG